MKMEGNYKFTTPPPPVKDSIVEFLEGGILFVTLNRPKQLNSINLLGHEQLAALWRWFDNEPSLKSAILTATGRAFCAGADLKEWNEDQSPSPINGKERKKRPINSMGFGGMSRRGGKKAIILAVDGICFGGGCEMAINADILLSTPASTFALPEVKIGVVALAGALTRLVRTVGKQRAMEMALTGRTLSAEEFHSWGVVNRIVPKEKLREEAIAIALQINANSPDSIIVTREGIKLGWEGVGAEEGTEKLLTEWYSKMEGGENMREGVRSFVERRGPKWADSKL